MTSYINEEILCEAYTRLNINIFNDKEKLAVLEKSLKDFFGERARFYLGQDVEIKVDFEEGSLITKLKVVGGAVAVMATALASYGSFRESVVQISQDATTLAQSANLEVIFRTKAAYCDRVSSERRKGIFGRVEDLIRKLDDVHEKVGQSKLPTSPISLKQFNSSTDALIAWDLASDKFFNKLTDIPTIACLSAGLLEELEKLPENTPWESDLTGASFRATLANTNAKLGGDIAGAAARYAASIREVKKSMRRRVDQHAPKPT